ncbi:recombinase family protein [Candidatus Uhrbacteria bacterium]|nr:recombinase family protein [Candidatus Uhrbacteria bacterium]
MEPETQKTGIIYCRVSSFEQVSNTSLGKQERDCREFAKNKNIEVLGVYVEKGESAKTADRTEFQKALKLCATRKPKVDFFIVHKVDRFSRNQADHVTTQVILKKVGTTLVSATEPIDQTVMGKAMEGMLSVWAELDNNIRAERSKNGMVEKTKRGIWCWSPPLGYTRLSKGGNLVFDDERAPFIRMAFEEYAKGTHSFKSLSDLLSSQGFRTRYEKKPCPQLMEKIIRNPVYYGLIKAFGLEVQGTYAPIISEELFWKCQPSKRNKLGAKRVRENVEFPLRAFTICAECGTPLTGSASTGRKGIKYPYYHHQKQGCKAARFMPKETLEQNFIEYLQEISPKPKFEKIFKAIVIETWQANYKRLDSTNARVRKEMEVLEGERQRVFDLHRIGKYDDIEFIEQKKLVNEKIYAKRNLLNENHVEEFNMEEALSYCFDFVRQSGKTWLELATLPAHRVRFQKQIFPEKVVFDGAKFGTNKLSLVYEINQQSDADSSQVVTF